MMSSPIPIRPEKREKSDRDDKYRIEVAPRKHVHASVAVKKLEKRIVRLAAQAITDFQMIEDGDKVLVAVSGGKDSYVLLDALIKLQARAPIRFSLVAVHINQHIPGLPSDQIEAYLKTLGIEYHIEDQDTNAIIERLIPSGKNVCSLCSRLRRGILYRVAQELHCTKIALGHQMDDVVGTLLLNMFYGGRIKAMPPILRSDDKKNVVIRPLVYLREAECAKWAKVREFPTSPNHLCGAAENRKRQEIKALIASWDKNYDSRIYNLFMSTTRVAPSQLADKTLFDFKTFRQLASENLTLVDAPEKDDDTNGPWEETKEDTVVLPDAPLSIDAAEEKRSPLERILPWRTPF